MFENIIEFYRLGKELGLTKREMKDVFLFKNHRYIMITIIFLIILVVFWVLNLSSLIIGGISRNTNTYASGTFYSSVSKKDFKLKSQ